MRILRSIGVWTAAGGLMLVSGGAGWSQQGMPCSVPPCTAASSQRPQQGSRTQPQVPGLSDSGVSPGPKIELEQAKLRNQERQKRLTDDTTKLLSLANELKADVDKSNKDMLSLDVIRKADEIEKLAHSVKEKMKGS